MNGYTVSAVYGTITGAANVGCLLNNRTVRNATECQQRMQQETRKATSADRQSQKAAEEQPSDHRNVNNVKTGQDTTRNAQGGPGV